MDPTQTWLMLLASWKERDWESLFEHADDLLKWLENGGFPPDVEDDVDLSEELKSSLVRAFCTLAKSFADCQLRSAEGLPSHGPFAFSCEVCGGSGPEFFFAAKQEGWLTIRCPSDKAQDAMLGRCPKCQSE